MTKCTDEILNKAIEMNQSGMSVYSIAQELGIERKLLTYHFKRIGYEYKRIKRRIDGITKETLLKLYVEEDLNLQEIGDKLGVTSTVIMNRCREYDIPYNAEGRAIYILKNYDVEKMYLEDEMSITDIANQTNVSTHFVKKYLKSKGVELRSPKEVTGLIMDNGNLGSYTQSKKSKYIDKKGREFYFRSSWENTLADWLDENNLIWDYEVQRFSLGRCNYLPDFFIYKENGELDYVIEVKGWFKEDCVRKMMLFQELYQTIDYYVVDYEIIQHLRKGRPIEKEVLSYGA